MKLFQRDEFIARIQYAISQDTQITLIVGAPISYDYLNKKGVSDVNAVIESILAAFSSDVDALARLRACLNSPEANNYQKAFEYVLGARGIRFANDLIRRSVLGAYEGGVSNVLAQDTLDDAMWYLPPAVNSIGRLLALKPDVFGNKIITTNFDPLIEVAVRRNGGSCYSTHFHRDGTPSTTSAKGVNVIHLHGFWQGSDTLHTPHQLKQNRPQLKGYLQDLFRRTLVVVVAYGGWDDVVGTAIEEVVLDDNSEPEVLWAFKNTEWTHLEISEPQLLSRLKPGLDRGRVQLYGGVDCHEMFPNLVDTLRLNVVSTDLNPNQPSRRLLSAQERILADVVGKQTERYVDATPRIDGFIGRDAELKALRSADASVICINGFGGQGKSALAAKLLSSFENYAIRDWRDCREEGNTAQTALTLFLERISQGSVEADSLTSLSQRDLVDLIVSYGADQDAILVLDNVDTYVDIDLQSPTGVIGVLCERLLNAKTGIKVVLTCRPVVQMAHSRFFGIPLAGLDEKSARQLFKNKSAGIELTDADCENLMHLTEGHPLYLSMLAAQTLSTGKAVSVVLGEVEASRSNVPAMILRSTYKLLKPEQTNVIRILAELERPTHETELEAVTGLRYNKLSKALKRLKDLSLVLERRDMSDKTLIDLHPLVRQFLRHEYPKKERNNFIGRVIVYFDKRLALVAKSLGKGGIPKSVLDVWTHKIEVLCNQSDWNSAIAELVKIEPELGRVGLGGEYSRLGVKIFHGVDWLVALDETKEFRRLINGVCHELSHHGDHIDVARWTKHYLDAVGGRGADRLNVLEILAFDTWLQKDFDAAQKYSAEAVDLSRQIDVSLPSSPVHTHALILRDSGDIDSALEIFLEGLSLEEALEEKNGKSPQFFGNIGRCFHLRGDFFEALKFYKRCGQEMNLRPTDHHSSGWLRLWAGDALCNVGRHGEGYAFLSAAKHLCSRASKLLEISADRAIGELRLLHLDIGQELVPEWRAEQMFNAWVLKE